MTNEQKIVVGISGASGAIYAKRLLDNLARTSNPIAIVMSDHARQIWEEELEGLKIENYDRPVFGIRDFNVPFVSGSNAWDACVVIPCSMGMLGRIAHGYSDDAIARTADVQLKERKKLILVPRETPYNLVHIENMRLLTLAGAVILPATPSFYSKPKTLEEAVDTVIARVLDHLGMENCLRQRWQEAASSPTTA
ncbi:MAG: UbiX family flavin prenyltransferase [Deltaproteobacteria bacterium]|nr:UbiX family flavin prenyltransferase [Deltaproteobacteria bacterium]